MTIIYVLAGVLGSALLLTLGYWYGLRRFQGELSGAVAGAAARARAESERQAAPALALHTVVLDGISESGKTTFMLRVAFPCTEQKQLLSLSATARQYLSRPLPLAFDWRDGPPPADAMTIAEAPEGVHALRFYDVSGERRGTFVNAMNRLAAEGPRNASVTALWVWDMSNGPANRSHFNKHTVALGYGSDNAIRLIKHIVVFLNKVDVLEKTLSPTELADLLEAEKAYIQDVIRSCFDEGKTITFHQGSTLYGDGMFDTYGAILTSLGLGEHFRMVESDRPATAVAS